VVVAQTAVMTVEYAAVGRRVRWFRRNVATRSLSKGPAAVQKARNVALAQ
jgi:hypothetical protein